MGRTFAKVLPTPLSKIFKPKAFFKPQKKFRRARRTAKSKAKAYIAYVESLLRSNAAMHDFSKA